MTTTAPIFVDDVRLVLNVVVFVFALTLQGVAFVHCLTQRSEGFPAIGSLPKGAWLGIIGVALLLTLLFNRPRDLINIFSMIGIAAAAIYLLDVRVGLKELGDGKGFW
ncbi:DUF2516 family protein [Spirilliplanes yamanashiensis]|uniref:DUF2516 family protein n=1 Tax=Spirilliplanes yamanashiensis TaxID=42233 RepID=A0A8J3Y5E5_9ACTN|nr:DUF2516 family protein [Spirilliplanes yamanashiensis]MDP9814436.1 hypothetical protein [Spirilliplanes yamanashiensis]GIJ02088.1 hypothetical protein Sya03_14400 [Spirilliplanes yamanashiensis]